MANKVDIPVVINGKVYTLSGYEGEDYLQNVATYINGKIAECKTSDQYRRMNTEYQGILLALNIADDYFKAKNQADSMVTEDSNKEQQLYDLRHEVIESQIKLESSARMIENITDSMIEQIDLAIKTMEGRKLANRDDDSFIKLDF